MGNPSRSVPAIDGDYAKERGARLLHHLALITPNWRSTVDLLPTDTVRPPVSFPPEWGYLSWDAEQRGCTTTVLDAYRDNLSYRQLAAITAQLEAETLIISTAPSYLFWRCPPFSVSAAQQTAMSFRQGGHGGRIVAVGPHGTTQPDYVLKRCPAIDAVFRGEPDTALLAALLDDSSEESEFLHWRSSTISSIAPELPLSEMKIPSGFRGYQPHFWAPSGVEPPFAGRSGALVEAARGCPYDCGFCFRGGFRRQLRLKTMDVLARELEQLQGVGVNYVYFIDETFGVPWRHYSAVLELLKSLGLSFGVQTRPDIWDDDKVARLRDSGCGYCEIGIEAVSSAGVDATGKFRSAEAAMQGAEALRRAIPVVGCNILDEGNPDLRLMPRSAAAELRDNEGDVPPPFMPYPDTPWGQRALGSLRARSDWGSAGDAYVVYRIAAAYPRIGWILRRVRLLRIVLHRSVRLLRGVLESFGRPALTRHEDRSRRRQQ